MRVSEYARDCLRTLRADTGIAYDERSRGTLQLFHPGPARRRRARHRGAGGVRRAHEPARRRRLASAELALAHRPGKLAGGLRPPNDDETGDCQLSPPAWRDGEAAGVTFRFGTEVRELVRRGGASRARIAGADGVEQTLVADRYVLAFGSYSRALAASLGLDLPVYPVKGYSLTVPLVDAARAGVHRARRDLRSR